MRLAGSGLIQVLAVIALLIGACGGERAGDEVGQATPTSIATTETAVAATQPTASSDTSTNGTVEDTSPNQPTTYRSSGTITLGGESYLFAVVDEGGSCRPDHFGVGFSAILTRVDGDGNPIERPDLPGSTEGMIIGLESGNEIQGVIAGSFGGTEWYAGDPNFEEGRIDSVDIDGSRVAGMATFVSGDGEIVEGSFEVACVDGSVRSSGSSGDFCDDVAASLAMDEDLDLGDPEIDRLLAQAVAEFSELRARAPEEISDDMDTLYEGLVLLEDIFADHGYDLAAIPDNEMQRLGDEHFAAAGQRLTEHCGLG